MKNVLRLAVTIISALATFYFTFWVGGALLSAVGLPFPFGLALAVFAAAAVTRYVWRETVDFQPGLVASVLLSAVVTGAIGFSAGFFGPMYFAPGANQGPLLGIFYTGPIGFVLGAVGGAVYWVVRK